MTIKVSRLRTEVIKRGTETEVKVTTDDKITEGRQTRLNQTKIKRRIPLSDLRTKVCNEEKFTLLHLDIKTHIRDEIDVGRSKLYDTKV